MDPVPPDARRRQQQIAERLAEIGFALPGSITERMMTCGKQSCRCRSDPPQRHGPYLQWTRTVDGKTVTKLLSPEQLDRYQGWFDNNRRLHELTARLQTVSIEAITAAEGWGAKD